jgi:superfamily II DNA or RNA helicase
MHGYFNQKTIFTMNSYIELNNKLRDMTDEEIIEKYSNKIIIMDEIHNVRGNDSGPMDVDSVYAQLRRLTSISNNVKVILSTATPMTDNVRQIEPIMSLLGEHRHISYNDTVNQVANIKYHGKEIYDNLPPIKVIPMSQMQEENYLSIIQNQRQHDVYKTNSQISLFCTRDKLYGNKIRNKIMLKEKKTTRVEPYDLKHKIITYSKYKINIDYEGEVTTHLGETSCKYEFFLNYLQNPDNEGTMFVFIEDVVGSGVEILTEILEIAGYSLYLGDDVAKISKRKRYTFCVGDMEMCPNIEHRIEGFSHPENKNGEYIKVLIGSKVMSESVTVKNARHFHCITPHWNNTVTSQALGRVLRTGSHNDLPEHKRVVNAFIYCATLSNEVSIDERKLRVSSDKLIAINKEIERMKLASVDNQIDRSCEPDTSTFIKHYLTRYEKILYPKLDQILQKGKQPIGNIIRSMEIHPDITRHLIIRTVATRRSVKNRFMSLFNDEVILHAHPDFALVTCNTISSKTYQESYIPVMRIKEDRKIVLTDDDVIPQIRKMNSVQLESMLEQAVVDNNTRITDVFKDVLYKYDNIIVHTLSYTKNYNSSYKAAIPIPNSPTGGLRAYNGSSWINLSYKKELVVMEHLRNKISDLIYDKINSLFLSGILSTIDQQIRLCIKITESGVKDTRTKHRGRMISTFVKKDLLILTHILSSDKLMKTLSNKYQAGYRVSSLEELTPDRFMEKYTMQELKDIIEQKIVEHQLLFII